MSLVIDRVDFRVIAPMSMRMCASRRSPSVALGQDDGATDLESAPDVRGSWAGSVGVWRLRHPVTSRAHATRPPASPSTPQFRRRDASTI